MTNNNNNTRKSTYTDLSENRNNVAEFNFDRFSDPEFDLT
jgi:hypothetical protein